MIHKLYELEYNSVCGFDSDIHKMAILTLFPS